MYVQLLAFHFPAGVPFDGALLGAIERAESGGVLRVLDVLYVGRDAETDELVAVTGRGRTQGSLVTRILDFRLDPSGRARATEQAVSAFENASFPDTLERLRDALPPGGSFAAVLVEHRWAQVVDEAVQRAGGAPVLTGLVGERELTACGDRLLAALETA
jgi:hypothetical protein